MTGVSVLGIFAGAAALIMVLSAFNGLERLVTGYYQAFDPDLKILPAQGQYLHPDSLPPVPSGLSASFVLEQKALLRFRGSEYIVTLKGVDEAYETVSGVAQKLRQGSYTLNQTTNGPAPALLGAGVAYYLGWELGSSDALLEVFLPRPPASGADLQQAFRLEQLQGRGIFSIQPETDETYVLVPLDFLQSHTGASGRISAVELKVNQGAIEKQESGLEETWGGDFLILNRREQQTDFYKVMKTEALFAFLMFALILAIATFTVAGSLTMLIYEKRRDLGTLRALGLTEAKVRGIFFREGLLISGVGGGLGLLFGSLIVVLQDHFGLLQMGEGYVVSAYPVELRARDFFLVLLTVLGLSATVARFTALRIRPETTGLEENQ